jgi:hypothetical protein
MTAIASRIDPGSDAFAANRAHMHALLAQLRATEARTRARSEESGPRFAKRGQILPRERIGLLLDPGAPVLELSTLAGWCQDDDDGKARDPATTVPGGGSIVAIGYVAGARCLVAADDAVRHREIPAGAGHRAGEPPAVRAPDRVGRRQPAQVSRRALHPGRQGVLQPRAPVSSGPAGDRRRARVEHRGRRLHDGALRRRDHGARARQGVSCRAAVAQGRHRRDRHRRRTRWRVDARDDVGHGRVPRRRRRRRHPHRADSPCAVALRRCIRPRICSASCRPT